MGWTQDAVAVKAGISKGFLSDLENGKRSISAENLLDLARVLGLSLDYIMTGEDAESQAKEVEIPANLAKFASQTSMSFRQALALLGMRRQILAHRGTGKKEGLDEVDWQQFYECVKEFL